MNLSFNLHWEILQISKAGRLTLFDWLSVTHHPNLV